MNTPPPRDWQATCSRSSRREPEATTSLPTAACRCPLRSQAKSCCGCWRQASTIRRSTHDWDGIRPRSRPERKKPRAHHLRGARMAAGARPPPFPLSRAPIAAAKLSPSGTPPRRPRLEPACWCAPACGPKALPRRKTSGWGPISTGPLRNSSRCPLRRSSRSTATGAMPSSRPFPAPMARQRTCCTGRVSAGDHAC